MEGAGIDAQCGLCNATLYGRLLIVGWKGIAQARWVAGVGERTREETRKPAGSRWTSGRCRLVVPRDLMSLRCKGAMS